jgi:hypothetical protein
MTPKARADAIIQFLQDDYELPAGLGETIEDAILEAVAAEREACAKIAESGQWFEMEAAEGIAAAIRGRGR